MQRTKVLTENTGKIFEKAICLTYGIPYSGPYKYELEPAQQLSNRLTRLCELFPVCQHTAEKGARYDYTALEDSSLHLSAKTTKKDGKVAPQVIGQPRPRKFCDVLGISYTDDTELKKYIQENIVTILPVLLEYTLDCPTLYYNEYKDTIRYIQLVKPIDWSAYMYEWTRSWETWGNSSTLKIYRPEAPEKKSSLLEMQFHTTRQNMANRWFFEEFIEFFQDHLTIQHL